VYGSTAAGEVVSETTCPIPQSSYGAEKLIIEILINDFSRRGLLDGRIARLPTVIVRPGKPSGAASSFASGIVRESLRGERNVLPVEEDLEMWICSPQVVVENLIRLRDVKKNELGFHRVVCLPGQTVRVGEILDVLELVGGKEKRALVEKRKNSSIEAIVERYVCHSLRYLSSISLISYMIDYQLLTKIHVDQNLIVGQLTSIQLARNN
jgi:nucleoside-diphosphate-sugar epimerase